ncbi:hypothetical protein [Quisquiliibacterium transsilvanicum]|jgi:hypothetical protein|uniref:YggT family protein n=1 Tax=Quisquiliibacterium transsilvanicum TaxID=1549638 RepID=A0A7W8HE51_9BURK|nr:hypothetical protein [Quisquiliibacterium transsilvanicum]MBB5270243.1 hypothetical protein [Quisquiliibacterium transsilvanicum]
MQLFLALVHELVKFAGLLLIGQGLVLVFSFGRHETNPVYGFFRFLTSPIVRATRAITPTRVADRHVPVVAFLLLFWLWFALIFVRRSLILQGAA